MNKSVKMSSQSFYYRNYEVINNVQKKELGKKSLVFLLGIVMLLAFTFQAHAWFLGSGKKAMKTPFPLPSVSMKSPIDGEIVDLEKLKGTAMLVNYWATWCKPCVEEMPTLNKLYSDLHEQNFTIVGISMDTGSTRPVKKLATKMGINYPIVMGSNKIAKKFGEIIGIPVTFLVDREGTVIKRYDGPREYEEFLKDIKEVL